MKYRIIRTDKASDQLYDIINYIAEDSCSIDIALNYLNMIERAIVGLEDFPYMGSIPRYSILKSKATVYLLWKGILFFIK